MDKKPQEKLTKEIVVMIQPSLYQQFKDKCAENYVSVSEVVRTFIRDYIKAEDK
jgi:metal-responsive CopG/Arc/MetJ family transcriptional regulator